MAPIGYMVYTGCILGSLNSGPCTVQGFLGVLGASLGCCTPDAGFGAPFKQPLGAVGPCRGWIEVPSWGLTEPI